MAHNHGNEYQLKIIHEDGSEELGAWMTSLENVSQVLSAVHRQQGKTYWLRERNVLCPNCPDREEETMEYPVTDMPSPRSRAHDSHYLLAVGSRNPYEMFDVVIKHRN